MSAWGRIPPAWAQHSTVSADQGDQGTDDVDVPGNSAWHVTALRGKDRRQTTTALSSPAESARMALAGDQGDSWQCDAMSMRVLDCHLTDAPLSMLLL